MRSLPLIIVALLSPPLLAHPGIGRILLERTVSPDNTCGGTVGYICPASLPCCSQYNWCGSTDAYCGTGCQSAFGTCSVQSSTTSSSTSSSASKSPASSSTSSSSTGTPTGVVSPDNSCGGTTGYICPSSLPCCSQYGWCGSTDDYCGANCQPAFGTCQGITPDNTCGSPNNYICPSSLPCCSQYGFCGSTTDYCGTGCQPGFGTCGGGTSSSSTSSPPSSSTSTSSGSTSTPTDPTANIPRPLVGNVPYGVTITECVTEGDIALTYDDGPYIYTSDLLDILDAAGVKATFFIVGDNGNGAIDQTPAWTSVIQRMYSEGHQVASHTWDHMDLTTLTSAARKEEMYKNEAAFSNILGVFPTYMRPPYLAFDNNCDQCGPDMVALGYHVISTDLDTKDYENDDPTLIQNSKDTFASYTALSPASNSYIVLTHDTHYQTVYNLTAYEIQRAAATGYRHVTVGECLGDPAANWYRAAPAAAAAAKANVALAKPQALTVQNFPPPTNVCTFVEDPAIKAVPFVAAVTNSTARLTKMARLKRDMMSEAVY